MPRTGLRSNRSYVSRRSWSTTFVLGAVNFRAGVVRRRSVAKAPLEKPESAETDPTRTGSERCVRVRPQAAPSMREDGRTPSKRPLLRGRLSVSAGQRLGIMGFDSRHLQECSGFVESREHCWRCTGTLVSGENFACPGDRVAHANGTRSYLNASSLSSTAPQDPSRTVRRPGNPHVPRTARGSMGCRTPPRARLCG